MEWSRRSTQRSSQSHVKESMKNCKGEVVFVGRISQSQSWFKGTTYTLMRFKARVSHKYKLCLIYRIFNSLKVKYRSLLDVGSTPISVGTISYSFFVYILGNDQITLYSIITNLTRGYMEKFDAFSSGRRGWEAGI